MDPNQAALLGNKNPFDPEKKEVPLLDKKNFNMNLFMGNSGAKFVLSYKNLFRDFDSTKFSINRGVNQN
jgi:hypothetical protein